MRHSLADISKVAAHLGYIPTRRIGEGLELAMPWFIRQSVRIDPAQCHVPKVTP